MTADGRTPFDRLKPVLLGLAVFYFRFMALTVGVTVLFGPYRPLGAAALLLTIFMPILALVLWGRSLDEELGWTDLDEGPW